MRIHWLAVLLLALPIAACDDDPSGPCGCPDTSPWAEVTLDTVPGESAWLWSIDCAGGDCLALGFAEVGTIRTDVQAGIQVLFYRPGADGGWETADLPGLPEENHFDVALSGSGEPVLAGYGLGGSQPFYATLSDARTEPPTNLTDDSAALVTVDADGDFFVAGGYARGGYLTSSQAPGNWNTDSFPGTFANDGGFHDVYVRGDAAVACGFDDGADTLQVVLRRTKSTDWEMVNRDGLEFAVELRCIALDDDGTIYLGGVQSPGGPGAQAWASMRSPTGEWTSMTLPDPVDLGRVNDILLASDGSIYLACSSEYEDANTGHLLRATASGIAEEISPIQGSMMQLAEASDGTIYAVGSRRINATTREPLLLERAP